MPTVISPPPASEKTGVPLWLVVVVMFLLVVPIAAMVFMAVALATGDAGEAGRMSDALLTTNP